MTSTTKKEKDWSATQYLKFGNERTRAVYDLISQVAPHLAHKQTPRIYDLGCGPGNSTKVLLDAFPNARITGMDSSPDMLSKARSTFTDQGKVDFEQGDLSTFQVPEAERADLIFSNAVFHWLRSPTRIPVLAKLFITALKSGGVMAIQVPDNYLEPSHSLMRETASLPEKSWSPAFSSTRIGDMADLDRPDLDPIEPPSRFYNALTPYSSSINIWRTAYQHVLKDAGAIVEWVKGTGLQPYLNRIEDEGSKSEFLQEYERRLKGSYRELGDGNVLLGYPRLFVVVVKK
ncbi:S-adenosyl-L-methionine-dependent methyltransferase [Setomelanomma holmii]|uniref:S-adenosyl-L-methionine-dependent methyltransferase n=1 Tax=Setomelanomma holmii TaxID=210430 RepID=A0A9P4LID2_9PLEO|nr:S-adenosyl-L-methionine-dependent methyltransferase [Setomelanomma holmii]